MPALDGRVIGITEQRRATELARIVENLGGTPLVAPTISVEQAIDLPALATLRTRLATGAVDWIVFQTGIGVQELLAAVPSAEREAFIADLGHCRIAARGPKPRQALASVGLSVHLAPAAPTTAGLIAALDSIDLVGKTVAVQLTGDENEALRQVLIARGAAVIELALYRYGPPPNLDRVRYLVDQSIAGHVDAMTFTSSPAVRGLFDVAASMGRADALREMLATRTVVAAVGPATAASLRSRGIVPRVVPERSVMGAMIVELAHALATRTPPSSLEDTRDREGFLTGEARDRAGESSLRLSPFQ